MKKTDPPITVKQTYHRPIEKVWEAITEPDQMRQWFFPNIPDFKPRIGFEIRFDVESDTKVFPHIWKVTRAEKPTLISYNWKYGGYAGDSEVVFELSEFAGGTALNLAHVVLADFEAGIPEFETQVCRSTWHYFLGERLNNHLELK